jgi:hypothetical protein
MLASSTHRRSHTKEGRSLELSTSLSDCSAIIVFPGARPLALLTKSAPNHVYRNGADSLLLRGDGYAAAKKWGLRVVTDAEIEFTEF